MWLDTLVHLMFMFVGLGIGSFAWASVFHDDPSHSLHWWLGGVIGLGIGWVVAAALMHSIRVQFYSRLLKSIRGETQRNPFSEGSGEAGGELAGRRETGVESVRKSKEALERGNVALNKGNLDLAILEYSEAIRLNSKDATAYNNRGIAYGRKGNLDQAIADYTEAIRLDPTDTVPYKNRSRVYAQKGDHNKANADFEKAKELGSKL